MRHGACLGLSARFCPSPLVEAEEGQLSERPRCTSTPKIAGRIPRLPAVSPHAAPRDRVSRCRGLLPQGPWSIHGNAFRVLESARRSGQARDRCRIRDVTNVHRRRDSCATPPRGPTNALCAFCEVEGEKMPWRWLQHRPQGALGPEVSSSFLRSSFAVQCRVAFLGPTQHTSPS